MIKIKRRCFACGKVVTIEGDKGEDCYICSKECKEEYYKQNLDGEEDNY